MHTSQLGLRIQGLPLPDHHIKLTRHVPHVCCEIGSEMTLRWNIFPEPVWPGTSSQDLPPGYAGHVSYVCGGVVDGIQHKIPQCEEDNLEALGEIIATAAVEHLTEEPHVENR